MELFGLVPLNVLRNAALWENLAITGGEHRQAGVDNTEQRFEGSKYIELDLAEFRIQYVDLANKLQADCGDATDTATQVSKAPIAEVA